MACVLLEISDLYSYFAPTALATQGVSPMPTDHGQPTDELMLRSLTREELDAWNTEPALVDSRPALLDLSRCPI